MIGEPRHIKPQSLVKELKEPVLLVGNGAMLFKDFFKETLGPRAMFPPPHLHYISPLVLGILAASRFQADQQYSPEEIRPIYIRPSDAELNLKVQKLQ
jgi:tRNA threonylcarbamoyladenosine biosynthesis protein TsaB